MRGRNEPSASRQHNSVSIFSATSRHPRGPPIFRLPFTLGMLKESLGICEINLMNTIPAIYEQGVFRPTVPVHLPEGTKVNIPAPESIESPPEDHRDVGMDAVYEILSHRYRSGFHDTAERHNEHQP